MNDPFDEKLARLRPAKPSAELMARLAAARPQQRPAGVTLLHGRVLPPAFKAAAAAGLTAAGFAVWMMQRPVGGNVAQSDPPAGASQARVFQPVAATNYLIDADETAVIELPNQPPVRLIRTVWLDDVTCAGTDPQSALQLIQAREQWVPVVAPQVY